MRDHGAGGRVAGVGGLTPAAFKIVDLLDEITDWKACKTCVLRPSLAVRQMAVSAGKKRPGCGRATR